MRKYLIGSMLLILAMALVACGDKEESEPTEDVENPLGEPVEISDDEKVGEDDVVAIINGDEVTGVTYNSVYAQLKLQSTQMGEEADLDEVKEATMESIIDQSIVIQEAKSEGIDITDDEIETEFTTMKEENEEALNTLLEQFQMTEEGFKKQLQFELFMNEYVDKTIDVSVSDEEVEAYYAEAKEETEEVPEFDEVKEQIKQSMEQDKMTEALKEKVDKVKEKAEIERKI